MEPDRIQAIAARDQLWSSLRVLLPEIEQLGQGHFENTERERKMVVILAQIVSAEMKFRAEDAGEVDPPAAP